MKTAWMVVLALVLLSTVLLCAQSVERLSSSSATIPDGTTVHVILMDDLQGKKLKVGDKVHFLVREDVRIGGRTVIRTNAEVVGSVAARSGKWFGGHSGKLGLQIESVVAVDGTTVRLRGEPGIVGGSNGAVTAAAVVTYGPGALFLRGWDASLTVGTMLNAFVDGIHTISVPGTAVSEAADATQRVN